MSDRFVTLAARGIEVVVDLAAGHLRRIAIEQGGRTLTPFHVAPWVDDPAITADESLPGNLRTLACDFFCAPFGLSDVDGSPPHGWPGNSAWAHESSAAQAEGGTVGRFVLAKRVLGARVVKEITLRDGHPFVYQRHIFEGGDGATSLANHAMTFFPTGGRLSFSPKAYAETPPTPLEPDPAMGRFALAYPARFTDLSRAPLASGGTADLRTYPFASRNEDFVMLVEAAGRDLGWAAALRAEGDVVLSLKRPDDFPATFLWISNGGRDYRPWNGRHVGVLGIEEARAYSAHGHRASASPNPLSQSGVPTAITLRPDGAVEVRHVIGALAARPGWREVTDVAVGSGGITVSADGDAMTVPFDAAFLAPRS